MQLPGAPSGQAAALRNGGRGKGGEGEKERGRAKGGGVGGRPPPVRKIGDGDEWQPAGEKKGLGACHGLSCRVRRTHEALVVFPIV